MKTILSIILLLAFLPATTAQVKPISAELGVQAYAELTTAGGYQWIVRGNVYPIGTYRNASACDYVAQTAIGTYAIYGRLGEAGSHEATYQISIRGKIYTFQGWVEYGEEENGQPMPKLYKAGLVGARSDDGRIDIEYAPRSRGCFGGLVRVYETER